MIRYIVHQMKKCVSLFMGQRIWKRIVMMLSSIVVFVTVYMMILPAITLEKSADVAGIELESADAEAEITADIPYAETFAEGEIADDLYPVSEQLSDETTEMEETSYSDITDDTDGYEEEPANADLEGGIYTADEGNGEEIFSSREDYLEGIRIVEGPDYTVTADVPKNACIPENAVLRAGEITNEECGHFYAQAEKALGALDMSFSRFFDIRFELETEDGVISIGRQLTTELITKMQRKAT